MNNNVGTRGGPCVGGHKDDLVWVDHRVGHRCILTVSLTDENLGSAKVKLISWHMTKAPFTCRVRQSFHCKSMT